MKKLIIFLVFFSVLKNSSAQNSIYLDSITTFGDDGYDLYSQKTEFHYANSGYLQSIIEYELGVPNDKRVFEKKIEYEYSKDRLTKKVTLSNWSPASNKWLTHSSETKVYNSKNQLLIDTNYSYIDSIGSFELSSKTIHHYDEQGNEIKNASYIYNAELDSMEFFGAYENKYTYELDSLSRIVKQWDYTKNTVSNDWELAEIHTYLYLENEIKKTDSTYRNSIWYSDVNIKRLDDKGKLLTDENYRLKNEEWLLTEKTDYKYDFFGDLISTSYSKNDSSILKKVEEFIYVYDYEIETDQINLPYSEFKIDEIQLKSFHKLDSVRYYGYKNNKVNVVGEVVFHYSFLSTAISDEQITDVPHLFPNPVIDNFSLYYEADTFGDIIIYNSKGLKVFERSILPKERLLFDSFTEGLYFYRLKLPNGVYSGKFLKL